MPTELPEYEVFALRYATREAQRRDHFIGGDPHDGPMPMDYFVWVAVGRGGAYLIDRVSRAKWHNSASAPSCAARLRAWSSWVWRRAACAT